MSFSKLIENLNKKKNKTLDVILKVFYYSYMPVLLFLGNNINLGFKSVDFR